MRMKVKRRTAGREKYEKPRLRVYQGQAQNWGIAITTLCRFLFLTRFWDDKAKALLVYGSPMRNCMVSLLLVGREGGRCTPFGEGPSRVGLMPSVWFPTYR